MDFVFFQYFIKKQKKKKKKKKKSVMMLPGFARIHKFRDEKTDPELWSHFWWSWTRLSLLKIEMEAIVN